MKLGLKLNRSDDLVEQYYYGPKERNQKVVFGVSVSRTSAGCVCFLKPVCIIFRNNRARQIASVDANSLAA